LLGQNIKKACREEIPAGFFLVKKIPKPYFSQRIINKDSFYIIDAMLKGISHLISPQLLEVMATMGHGDELVLADAHFPGNSMNNRVIRADGLKIADLLSGILPLFELDTYVEHPLAMMQAVDGDTLDPEVEKGYLVSIQAIYPIIKSVKRIERFDFYERSKQAFAVVMTGETAKYGNIILKKGVTPL